MKCLRHNARAYLDTGIIASIESRNSLRKSKVVSKDHVFL